MIVATQWLSCACLVCGFQAFSLLYFLFHALLYLQWDPPSGVHGREAPLHEPVLPDPFILPHSWAQAGLHCQLRQGQEAVQTHHSGSQLPGNSSSWTFKVCLGVCVPFSELCWQRKGNNKKSLPTRFASAGIHSCFFITIPPKLLKTWAVFMSCKESRTWLGLSILNVLQRCAFRLRYLIRSYLIRVVAASFGGWIIKIFHFLYPCLFFSSTSSLSWMCTTVMVAP